MTRFRPRAEEPVRALARRASYAVALLCVTLGAPRADAYQWYDDGLGSGCVACHAGFVGGNGPLHFQHRSLFSVTTCNVCHPSGGGSTPVLTYSSGSGGGFGCAGCHGHDYGETSPNSLQPKATAYGLRQFHVNQGETSCGAAGGCHLPGMLGHSDPFPTLFGEDVPPLYYDPLFSNLTDPCSSDEEDLSGDGDSVGLDNDGDGSADWPADGDCSPPATPTPSPTPTPTPAFNCGPAPAGGCIAPGKAVLVVNEKTAGKETLRLDLRALQIAVGPSELGNPVSGSTAYKVCIYDGANALRGEYTVARAGEMCGDRYCWSTVPGKGTKYRYRDRSTAADGIMAISSFGGDAGKGKVTVGGRNKTLTMPTGVAAALQNQTSATVQVLTSDASCFGTSLTEVKKADGVRFHAVWP